MSRSLSHTSPFDSIRQMDNGREFWSARDLQELLGYVDWRNFDESIERAMISCEVSGQNVSDHWTVGVTKSIISGKGRKQEAKDYHLTRYACYLTAMNGDVRKPEIAAAQAYFVAKTREAEIGHQPQNLFELFDDAKELRGTIEDLEDKSLSIRKMLQFLKFGESLRYPCQSGRTRGKRRTPRIELRKANVEIKQLLLFFAEE